MAYRRLHRLCSLLLSSTLFGCVPSSAPDLRDESALRDAMASGSTSAIAGRIRWLENGAEKKIGKGLFAFSIAPMLLRMEDGSRILGEIDEAGGFVWALEPGIYVINRINYRDPWSGNYFVVPKVAFRVPGPGRVYYVGTLTADFEPKRDLIGGLSGKLQVRIEDEFEGDYSPLAAELGLARGEIEQSLIVHASDLPQTIDSTAEFQLAMQVLNAALYGLSQ